VMVMPRVESIGFLHDPLSRAVLTQ
jgi:hypothetical protein